MALSIFDKFIRKIDGTTVPYVTVIVKLPGGSLALLYDNREGLGDPLPNPFSADSQGRAQFYIAGGRYDITVNIEEGPIFYPDVLIGREVIGGVAVAESFAILRDFDEGNDTVFVAAQSGIFQIVTGESPGTFEDDGISVIVPSGGDGSSAWIRQGMQFLNGTQSSPAVVFASDRDTGLYRKAENFIGIATGGVDRAVITELGRFGVGIGSPQAKLQAVVNNDATCCIRSSSHWTGTTEAPYQNNDSTLFETFNKIESNSINYSWSVSAPNAYNDIPVDVTDGGIRVGVYGWAVSTPIANYIHAGTLEFQFGVWGRAGFLAPGTPTTGVVNNAIGVRGDIVADSSGATIHNAVAGEFTSTASTGEVNHSYAVRASAFGANIENWSFHGDAGKFYNNDQALFKSKFTEMNSQMSARGVGNAIEFGFPGAGGYGSSIGAMPSSGNPFISLCASVDQVTDTFTTTGQLGFVIVNNLATDSLILGRVPVVMGAGQLIEESFRIDNNNRVKFQETPIIPSFTPISSTAPGQAGQICWDELYIYVCVETNTWRRSALSSW